MNKTYKMCFLGYRPNEVEKKLNLLNKEYEQAIKEYNDKIFEATEKNKKLNQELENIKIQMESYKSLKNSLVKVLYDSHISANESVFNAVKKLEDMINYKTQVLQSQEKKNTEMKISINKLLTEIQAIVDN